MFQVIRLLLPIVAAALILFGCNQNNLPSETNQNGFYIERRAPPAVISRIAFGSCNKQEKPQPLWSTIISNKPDLWIWLGDNIYADTKNMKDMQRKYQLQKSNKDYQTLLQSTYAIGIWDDHDYGENNRGKEYSKKAESQQLFLDFLDEPENSPRRRQEGVYTAYNYGSGLNQVKVILLDVRYHKDAPGTDSDILGDKQWQWLENQLKTSKAAINLIASGIQIIPDQHKYEKWASFPQARKRLFDLIQNTKVPGVILLSGDRHFAEISKIKLGNGYPLYEVTSSGLTHSWDNLDQEHNQYRQGNFFKSLNFGTIEIDWNSKPVKLKLQVRDRHNQIQL
ncbi:MAG TPA: alkaline phosphatase [Cyanobacteria bacterium UBA11372]|nr:alkaline phosphatase [Cyanobacteria bacterium UBA11372]